MVRMRSPVRIWIAAPETFKAFGFRRFFFYRRQNWRPHPLARSAFQSEVVPGSRGACSAGHGLQFESGSQLQKPSKPSGFEGFSFTVGKTGDLIPLCEVSLSVAALSERLRQLQIARHSRRTCRLSSLSLRGAKRRGNLAVPYRISRKLRRNRNCLPEIAASACGLLAMTRQGGAPAPSHG